MQFMNNISALPTDPTIWLEEVTVDLSDDINFVQMPPYLISFHPLTLAQCGL